MVFTKEKPNMSRQIEFDWMKALAIFGMVIVHVYEELSCADLDVMCSGFFDCFIQFFGGPFAAPVFMSAMGVGMVYSSHRSPAEMLHRGVHIFLLGYILNFVRDCIPYIMFCGFSIVGEEEFWYCFLNVDILQFAGLTFMLTGLLKKCNVPVLGLGAIAILFQIIGQGLTALFSFDNTIARCLVGLIFYTGPESCFPLLSWFIYPVLGMVLAKYLRHVQDVDRFYKLTFFTSFICLFGYIGALFFGGYDIRNFFALADDVYYKQSFLSVLFTVLVVLTECSAIHFLCKWCKAETLPKSVKFMSNNLNQIYIAQWLLIAWSVFAFEICNEFCFPLAFVIPAGLLYLAAATALVVLFLKLKNRKKG